MLRRRRRARRVVRRSQVLWECHGMGDYCSIILALQDYYHQLNIFFKDEKAKVESL